ncbi:MAG: MFS transporter, partial [Alicyclobacillus macrosporangiidus]|uniref:MFS transporter n=1 Tax=Alicyclobacillus macrosporangiidus TaxID=392015 RepID=UPI0026F2C90B
GKLMFSRKVVIVCGLLGAAVCVGLTGTVQTAASAVVLMTFGIFFMYITGAMYWSIIRDNVNASKVGGASGFVHALSNISGIIAPSVTGFIVQFTGSFTSAFLLAGLLAVIGAVCVLLFVKPLRSPSAVLSESGLEGTV